MEKLTTKNDWILKSSTSNHIYIFNSENHKIYHNKLSQEELTFVSGFLSEYNAEYTLLPMNEILETSFTNFVSVKCKEVVQLYNCKIFLILDYHKRHERGTSSGKIHEYYHRLDLTTGATSSVTTNVRFPEALNLERERFHLMPPPSPHLFTNFFSENFSIYLRDLRNFENSGLYYLSKSIKGIQHFRNDVLYWNMITKDFSNSLVTSVVYKSKYKGFSQDLIQEKTEEDYAVLEQSVSPATLNELHYRVILPLAHSDPVDISSDTISVTELESSNSNIVVPSSNSNIVVSSSNSNIVVSSSNSNIVVSSSNSNIIVPSSNSNIIVPSFNETFSNESKSQCNVHEPQYLPEEMDPASIINATEPLLNSSSTNTSFVSSIFSSCYNGFSSIFRVSTYSDFFYEILKFIGCTF